MTRRSAGRAGLLPVVLLVAFVLKLGIVLAAADRGFELGDEGFFLLNLKYPQAAPPPLEGYRVLGRLCGGSCDVGIVAARLYRDAAELLGSLALVAGVFAWARARVFAPGDVGFGTFLGWCLLGTLLSVESRSLGYNDLGNLLCFGATGALFALDSLPPSRTALRALLAAVAGALLGLQLPVKWPPAVTLAALFAAVLLFGQRARPWRERLAPLAAGALGLALSAGLVVLALGGVEATRARFEVAFELIALTSHEPLELLRLYVVLDKFTWVNGAGFALLFALTFQLARRLAPDARDRTLAGGVALATAALVEGVLLLHPTFVHWSVLVQSCFVMGLALVLLAFEAPSLRTGAGDDRIPMLLLLFALPFVVIVGTNVTMTMRLPTHGLPHFVLLAVLVLHVTQRIDAWRFRTAVGLLLLVITGGVFVRHHVVHPYGLPRPISEQRYEAWNLPGVKVDVATRDFLNGVALAMSELGYRHGDPVIAFDYMPGLVYYLGGTSPRYNFYMFRSPAYNCYNLNRAELGRPPFLILAKPMDSLQRGCLKAIDFPKDFRMPRTVPFAYEKVYEGFSARGFSKLYLYGPRDGAGPEDGTGR